MKTCFEHTVPGQHPVKLEQRADRTFRVTYGQQVMDNMTYDQAAYMLGHNLFHALACAGELNNEDA